MGIFLKMASSSCVSGCGHFLDSSDGHDHCVSAPMSSFVKSPHMVPGQDAEVLGGLPSAVLNTITSARAPSTRHAYRLKWNLFTDWCSYHREEPRRCPIMVMLSFLQQELERRLSPSTLKVYVPAIATHPDAVDDKSVGKHDLVIRFLRGTRRFNPLCPHLVPSWDLPLVLTALKQEPFEPLQSVELKRMSLKTVLLIALASVKRIGDLQAFSVDDSCLQFRSGDSHFVLRPRPRKGKALSKQRLAHWILEDIVFAYQAQLLPCPLVVREHFTRGVASSWAIVRGASIADICRAAGWATPNMLATFYNLRVEPVSSRVLASGGQ